MPISDNPGFDGIYKSEKYLLCRIYERAYLLEYEKNSTYELYKFYGEPTCGLVYDDDNIAIVGGDVLVIWKKDIGIEVIGESDIKFVFGMRKIGDDKIEVLTDPWSKDSAIWIVDIKSLDYKKLSNFNDYIEKEYSDEVAW